ncbi:MAG: hypothetical protein KH347_03990 [Acetobacter sp.]|nr:hypothetical protein [Acetobacter sp.]
MPKNELPFAVIFPETDNVLTCVSSTKIPRLPDIVKTFASISGYSDGYKLSGLLLHLTLRYTLSESIEILGASSQMESGILKIPPVMVSVSEATKSALPLKVPPVTVIWGASM